MASARPTCSASSRASAISGRKGGTATDRIWCVDWLARVPLHPTRRCSGSMRGERSVGKARPRGCVIFGTSGGADALAAGSDDHMVDVGQKPITAFGIVSMKRGALAESRSDWRILLMATFSAVSNSMKVSSAQIARRSSSESRSHRDCSAAEPGPGWAGSAETHAAVAAQLPRRSRTRSCRIARGAAVDMHLRAGTGVYIKPLTNRHNP